MNFLLWINSVIEIYDFCCNVSQKLSPKHTAKDKLDSINQKLVQIQEVFTAYLPQREEQQVFYPYASTIFDEKLLYKDTIVKKIKESIIESTLEKTVVMEQQSKIINICKDTIGKLKTVLANMPPLESNEMANLAGILEINPQLSQSFSAQEIPLAEQKTLTMENVEFTISQPMVSGQQRVAVKNFPQRKVVAQCVNCSYQVKEKDVQYNRVILRKKNHYCMDCICDKDAGDFPTIGKYRILDKLGEGGMADVFLAVHKNLRTTVAFKWLKDMTDPTPQKMRRFKLDCQISANLRHPGVVQFFDAGNDVFHESKQLYYIVMEVVEGKTLDDYQKQYGNFGVAKTIAIAQKMCDILNYAYSMSIVHRDLKPSNIFILEDNSIKLGDFGLAKYFDEHNLSDATKSGMAMGTIEYMPPEQFLDARDTDQRSDIYSLGATLYELLTGQHAIPRNGCDLATYVEKVIIQPPVAPSVHCKEIPLPLDNIILKCLEKKAAKRYQRPLDIIEDLNKVTL